MRNFSSKRRENFRRSSSARLLYITVPVALAIVFVMFGHWFFGDALSRVTSPLFAVRAWVTDSISTFPSYVRDRSLFVGQITTLEEELARLQSEYQSGGYLEDENARLRGLLSADAHEERIAAGVLARPPFIPYDTLLIDRGSVDGVNKGAVVYRHADQVVGVVERVFGTSALVTMLSTPGVKTAVYVIGPDIYTTAFGEGGGVLRGSVPQGVSVSEGDTVVLPGLARGMVGKVASVRTEATEPDQSAFVTIGAIQSLRYVGVGTRIPEEVTFEEAGVYVEEYKDRLFAVPIPPELEIGDIATTSTSTESVSEEGTIPDEEAIDIEPL